MENKNYIWKGLMLDTARHMPSLKYLYKTVDKMSELGLNVLHLHLSDDQGFRIEIKSYPRLNSVGSYRRETVVGRNFPSKWTNYAPYVGDGEKYGGYYTQVEIRELIAYAKKRNIEIVPEIDIPGHTTAILASYPEFAEGVPPHEVLTHWGVFNNVIQDSEPALTFLKKIFDEIIEIFESEYIHIGGDEIRMNNYNGDEMAPLKIIKEIKEYLHTRGKKVVVWEEVASIIEPQSDDIIMNWKDMKTGYELLKQGKKVVFCPRDFFYFDYSQKEGNQEPISIGGLVTCEKVDSFSIDNAIFTHFKDNIVGIQANLWTEYMYSEDIMDYMLYPRLDHFAKLT